MSCEVTMYLLESESGWGNIKRRDQITQVQVCLRLIAPQFGLVCMICHQPISRPERIQISNYLSDSRLSAFLAEHS